MALLKSALEFFPNVNLEKSWMVGDGVTDIAAGQALGLNTAFVGTQKCDQCALFSKEKINPTSRVSSLSDFADYLMHTH